MRQERGGSLSIFSIFDCSRVVLTDVFSLTIYAGKEEITGDEELAVAVVTLTGVAPCSAQDASRDAELGCWQRGSDEGPGIDEQDVFPLPL